MKAHPRSLYNWWYRRRRKEKPSPKRPMHIYSREQLAVLREHFSGMKFLTNDLATALANQLNLDTQRIRLWWRHRRYAQNVKNRIERQSISDASTPSPVPLNTSSPSPLPYQSQLPGIQSTNTLNDNLHPTSYQQTPEQYMTQSNSYPQNGYETNLFSMNGQTSSYSYENVQNFGVGMVYNAAVSHVNEHSVPPPCYYDGNFRINTDISYSNWPSTELTNNYHQNGIGLEYLPLLNDSVNTNNAHFLDDLNRYMGN